MKINVETIDEINEEKILIQCYEVTKDIAEIIGFIKSRDFTLEAYNDSKIYQLFLQDIYYIEAVDNRVFAYLENQVYELKSKLYELQSMYEGKKFFRCSKSVLVNLIKIECIKPALNGRFMAKLTNGEAVIISRQYVPELKGKLRGDA